MVPGELLTVESFLKLKPVLVAVLEKPVLLLNACFERAWRSPFLMISLGLASVLAELEGLAPPGLAGSSFLTKPRVRIGATASALRAPCMGRMDFSLPG